MEQSLIWDVAFALFVVFALGALICTAVVERVSVWLRLRARCLEDMLRHVMPEGSGGRTVFDDFLNHPLIKTLCDHEGQLPSYLEPDLVARVWCDLLDRTDPTLEFNFSTSSPAVAPYPGALARLARSLGAQLPSASPQAAPASDDEDAAKTSKTTDPARRLRDDTNLRHALAKHYEAMTDRTVGHYKRRVQGLTLAVALAVSLLANFDTLAIVHSLSTSSAQRAQSHTELERLQHKTEGDSAKKNESGSSQASAPSAQSEKPTSANDAGTKTSEVDAIAAAIGIINIGIPIGWTTVELQQWLTHPFSTLSLNKIMGLLISALALSLGAPFWFKLLQTIGDIRGTGKKPAKVADAGADPSATSNASAGAWGSRLAGLGMSHAVVVATASVVGALALHWMVHEHVDGKMHITGEGNMQMNVTSDPAKVQLEVPLKFTPPEAIKLSVESDTTFMHAFELLSASAQSLKTSTDTLTVLSTNLKLLAEHWPSTPYPPNAPDTTELAKLTTQLARSSNELALSSYAEMRRTGSLNDFMLAQDLNWFLHDRENLKLERQVNTPGLQDLLNACSDNGWNAAVLRNTSLLPVRVSGEPKNMMMNDYMQQLCDAYLRRHTQATPPKLAQDNVSSTSPSAARGTR